jgi:hypothetical protein
MKAKCYLLFYRLNVHWSNYTTVVYTLGRFVLYAIENNNDYCTDRIKITATQCIVQ